MVDGKVKTLKGDVSLSKIIISLNIMEKMIKKKPPLFVGNAPNSNKLSRDYWDTIQWEIRSYHVEQIFTSIFSPS